MSLNAYAVKEAIQLALGAETRNLAYLACPNTPLASLVNRSTGLPQAKAIEVTQGTQPTNEYVPDVDYIVGCSNGWGASKRGEVDAHQLEISALCALISEKVNQHFAYARGTVSPVVIETINRFNEAVKSIGSNALGDVSVQMIDLPGPLKDATVLQDVESFAGRTVGTVDPVSCGEQIEAEMVEAISRTPEIAAWLATKGEGFVAHCWKEFFSSISNGSVDALRSEEIDEILAVYLLAQAYFDKPAKGTKGSLMSYNAALAALRDQAANRLSFESGQHAAMIQQQQLIKSWDSKCIYVIKQVFDDWNNPNAQSLIIASAMNAKPAIYLNQIVERSDELMQAWQRHLAAHNRAVENNRFVIYRDVLGQIIPAVVRDMADQIYAATMPQGQAVSLETHPLHLEFHKLLPKLLNDMRQADIDKMHDTITRVVCLSVFYFTDAYKILHGIDQACRKNPDLDAASAQAIVRTEYATDFVFDQLVVRQLV